MGEENALGVRRQSFDKSALSSAQDERGRRQEEPGRTGAHVRAREAAAWGVGAPQAPSRGLGQSPSYNTSSSLTIRRRGTDDRCVWRHAVAPRGEESPNSRGQCAG